MATSRLLRTLSIFNHSAQKWTPIPSSHAKSNLVQRPSLASRSPSASQTQRLSLVSWNIDAFSPRPVARAKLILDYILEGPKPPDIIFLQEVSSDVRAVVLGDARVRAALLVTDAEDQTSFQGVPFATMTLMSSARFASGQESRKEGGRFMLRCVSRVILPSKYKRDGLCVDIIPKTAPPGVVFRFVNVHLDSLWQTQALRAQQMKILADVLREPGCSGGIIAGDFNAISPEDEGLIDKNDLVDAWVALHGRADRGGATWGVGAKRRNGLGLGRLDRVAMMGLKAEEMEVLRPCCIEVPRPVMESNEIPWSDHDGLRCTLDEK